MGSVGLTVVVGGGPAGSACAWKLAVAGRPVRVFEKEPFPRNKICGGVLSHRASMILLESGMLDRGELDSLTRNEIRKISFWYGDERLRLYGTDSRPARIISRGVFDGYLLEKAAGAGALVTTGCRVESVEDGKAVTSCCGSVSYSNLVGADGCAGIVRKTLPRRRSRKTGMGVYYLVPPERLEHETDELEVHFGHVSYGYAWIIPCIDVVNVGIGVMGSPASPSDVLESLYAFVASRSVDVEGLELYGAVMPSLRLDTGLGSGNVYLAGDAAGTVDHVSGEGIGHAVESGMMVADDIISGNGRDRALTRGSCVRRVRQSMFYRHLLYGRMTMHTAMAAIRDDETFAREYWNMVSGPDTYHDMFGKLLGWST